MIESLFLKEVKIHRDWLPFLEAENRCLIKDIEAEVMKDEYTPQADKVLRFLSVPLLTSRVVIIGQDPYPQPGVATGRAFEVGNLKSWNQPFQNVSLKNILRAVYKAYTGTVISYNQLKQHISSDFPVLPPDQFFGHWEQQGVLLLNTSYTCKTGLPGSHQKIWNLFSQRLLQYISVQAPGITWFIWGGHATKVLENLTVKKSMVSKHPMMCYYKPDRIDDFLYGQINCFDQFKDEIDWTGYAYNKDRKTEYKLF